MGYFPFSLVKFGVSSAERNFFWNCCFCCCHYCQLTPQIIIFFLFFQHKHTKRMIRQTLQLFHIVIGVSSLCVDNEERVKTILYNKYVEKLFTFIKLIFQTRNWSVSIFVSLSFICSFGSFTYSRTYSTACNASYSAVTLIAQYMTGMINNK